MASDDRKLEPEESNRLRVGDVLVSSTCNEETVDYGGHRRRQKTSEKSTSTSVMGKAHLSVSLSEELR